MRILLPFVFLLFTGKNFSQTSEFIKVQLIVAGQFPQIEKAHQGGWIVSSGNGTFIKYSECGDPEWEKIVSSHIGELSYTNDGYLISPAATNEPLLMKLDQSGNVKWTKKFICNAAKYYTYSSGEFSNGDLFISGAVTFVNNGPASHFLVKTDSLGNIKWSKFFDVNGWGFAIPCWDGGILARSGYTSYKTDNMGNLLWSKSYIDGGFSFKPLEVSDGFVFARYGETGKRDTACLYKIDKQGNLKWVGDGFSVNYLMSLQQKNNGNFVTVGRRKFYDNHSSALPTLVELSSQGKFLNQVVYTTTNVSQSANDLILHKNIFPVFVGGAGFLSIVRPGKNNLVGCGDSVVTEYFPPKAMQAIAYPLQTTAGNFTAVPVVFNTNATSVEQIILCSKYDSLSLKLPNLKCLKEGDTLFAQAGYSYHWSNGSTAPFIVPQQEGIYSLALIDSCMQDTIISSTEIKFCEFVSVKEEERKHLFEFYPNPATHELTVKASEEIQLTIQNIFGQQECKFITNAYEDLRINVSGLAAGVYFITAKSRSNIFTQKLIKE